MNRNFPSGKIQTADRNMKNGSGSLDIRETHSETTMSFYLTPVGMKYTEIKTHMLARLWGRGKYTNPLPMRS